MSTAAVKSTVNKIFEDAGQAPIVNWNWEFADGCKMLSFFNILFNDSVKADIKPTQKYEERITNWNTLNKEIFVDELARRVYLDDESVKILAKGQSSDMIIKLLAVLIGFYEGTAEAYATEGEIIELGEIDEEILQEQQVKWNIEERYETASDTSEEERKTGVSRQKVIQEKAKRTVVETRRIEQEPLVEDYTTEELVEERRKKPRRASRASRSRVVVEEETESEEEVVEVRRRPKRRVQVRRPSRTRKVEYVDETFSESEEEVVQVKRPVIKQRVVQQEAKQQLVIVEQPQVKVTKSAKETIKIPVQKTKTEYIKETVNIETQEDRDRKASLANLRVEKEHAVKMKARQIELARDEAERAREMLERLEQDVDKMCTEYEEAQHEFEQVCIEHDEMLARKTTEVVERAIEKTYTDYVEKKVRRQTTETPVPNPEWEEQIKVELERKSRPSSPTRSQASLKKERSRRGQPEDVDESATKKAKAQTPKVNKKK